MGLTPDLGPGLKLNPNHNLDQSLGHRQNPQTNFANLERALKKALRRQCSPTYRTSPRAHIKLPATGDLSSIQKTGALGRPRNFANSERGSLVSLTGMVIGPTGVLRLGASPC